MAEFPALNLYTDAFIADTPHMDARATGAYFCLLMASWRTNDGGLPDNDKLLARMARCSTRDWKAVREVVMAFWTMCQDGKWRQKRLEIERELARDKSSSASRSAKARWLKHNERRDADASSAHIRNACESDATTSTSTTITEEPPIIPLGESRPNQATNGHDGAHVTPPSDNRRPGSLGDVLGRFVSTAPAKKRLKRQVHADRDMARWLTSHGGFDAANAWALLLAARTPGEEGHAEAARHLEKLSRQHRLGWFAEDDA